MPPHPNSLANLRARSRNKGAAYGPALGFRIAMFLAARTRPASANLVAEKLDASSETIRKYLDAFTDRGLLVREYKEGVGMRYAVAPATAAASTPTTTRAARAAAREVSRVGRSS